MSFTPALQTFFDPWFTFLSEDPLLFLVQLLMLLTGAIVIFFVFYATRDILLRTNSFFYMFFCIVLVALVPLLGFLVYLLIRPPRTLKERELETMIRAIHENTYKKPRKSSARKRTSASKSSAPKADPTAPAARPATPPA